MEYILIGKIHNTFGIKGELKVEVYTDFLKERFAKNTKIYLGKSKEEVTIKSYRFHNDYFLLSLLDKEDINSVEGYKGMEIYKNSADIPALKEGEYYFRDLKNLEVYVNGIKKGYVKDVEEGLRNNYLRVACEDKEVLVPFIPVFIKQVDLDKKMIEVVEMAGLL